MLHVCLLTVIVFKVAKLCGHFVLLLPLLLVLPYLLLLKLLLVLLLLHLLLLQLLLLEVLLVLELFHQRLSLLRIVRLHFSLPHVLLRLLGNHVLMLLLLLLLLLGIRCLCISCRGVRTLLKLLHVGHGHRLLLSLVLCLLGSQRSSCIVLLRRIFWSLLSRSKLHELGLCCLGSLSLGSLCLSNLRILRLQVLRLHVLCLHIGRHLSYSTTPRQILKAA